MEFQLIFEPTKVLKKAHNIKYCGINRLYEMVKNINEPEAIANPACSAGRAKLIRQEVTISSVSS